jgi:hypothetical protein
MAKRFAILGLHDLVSRFDSLLIVGPASAGRYAAGALRLGSTEVEPAKNSMPHCRIVAATC